MKIYRYAKALTIICSIFSGAVTLVGLVLPIKVVWFGLISAPSILLLSTVWLLMLLGKNDQKAMLLDRTGRSIFVEQWLPLTIVALVLFHFAMYGVVRGSFAILENLSLPIIIFLIAPNISNNYSGSDNYAKIHLLAGEFCFSIYVTILFACRYIYITQSQWQCIHSDSFSLLFKSYIVFSFFIVAHSEIRKRISAVH